MSLTQKATKLHVVNKQTTQPSRKGKKAWRKNVDVTDIHIGLEQVRKELIHGGVITEKASEELFRVDTHGDNSVRKRFASRTKTLKADEIIAQRSFTPVVSSKKRSSEKISNGIIEPKRQRTYYVSHRELSRLRDIANGRSNNFIHEPTEVDFDIWNGETNCVENTLDERFSFLEKKRKKVAPVTLSHEPITLVASGRQLPAISKPHGGYSYNPLVTEYTKCLEAIGNREVEAERARNAICEAERVQKEALAKSAAEAEKAEARASFLEWEEDSTWEGCDSDMENFKLSSKRPQRKTQAQRNRIKRRKEAERKAKLALKIKQKNSQVAQIKELVRELENRNHDKQQDVVDHSSTDEDFELRRRKLGKVRLPEKNIELVLPDELQDSLRLLKPEGNLLRDRYRSMLMRGKFESRRRISFAKKAKRKTTEKWTHKDFVLP
ncbi:BgTH12-04733 [Blumeria graminis f. sp. triticale]|uniref:Ribosome biogenesis protein NOP53 n=3 Tax=Blumeria graminis TaxID=34373 RepID=A0A381L865_BLUGR|nr:hypothetical protein BGT96224_322 [Blumeria graminis f. sp. tritici 96224]CAD6499081.1 BgTH12-04733 [Blumeria graminis f. sp. triticale]VCU39216.1 Bgt-322 [Blumeria graminis f. sp. tritici]